MMKTVILICLMIHGFLIVSGQSLTLIQNPEYASRGKYLDLFCTLTFNNQLGKEFTIEYYRGQKVATHIVQKGKLCDVSPGELKGRYGGMCVSDAKIISSGKRKYQLRIATVSMDDQAEWTCQLKSPLKISNKINLKVYNFIIQLNDLRAPVLGKEYTMSCIVGRSERNGPSLNDDICFVRNKKSKWCMRQEGDKCYSIGGMDFNYQCVCMGNTKKSITYSYQLVIKRVSTKDKSDWWCELEKSGIRSNILKVDPRESLAAHSSTAGLVSRHYIIAVVIISSIVEVGF